MQLKAIIKTAAACIAIYILLKFCIYLLSPFLLALIISIAIEPGVNFIIKKLHIKRSISIVVALSFFCCLSFFMGYFLIHNIYIETLSIIKNAPYYYEALKKFIENIYVFLEQNLNITLDAQNLTSLGIERILKEIVSLSAMFKDKILKIFYSAPDIFMYITFSIIAAFFISRDKEKILSAIKKILPCGIIKIVSKLNNTLLSIIKTECALVLISTLITITGFMMLNIDYAVILGIICGILDILPLLGPGMLFLPWSLYSIIRGKIVFSISLLCLYIIIIITRQMLEARFISGKLDLHPLIILISIYIGLKFFGILGVLLGPVSAMLLKMIYQESKS